MVVVCNRFLALYYSGHVTRSASFLFVERKKSEMKEAFYVTLYAIQEHCSILSVHKVTNASLAAGLHNICMHRDTCMRCARIHPPFSNIVVYSCLFAVNDCIET